MFSLDSFELLSPNVKALRNSIVTESRLNDFVIFENTALRLKYAIWLVEIMMQCN